MTFRNGFACFVGRPNVGKSTLTNALVGQKVAITSNRPQTTRRAVRGVVHRDDGQIVLVDTPGLHRPRTLLGQRLNDLVRSTLAEVDVIVLCLPANEKIGPGDRFLAQELAETRTPVIAAVTKTDTVGHDQLPTHLLEVGKLGEWAEIIPVSAVNGDQVELLADLIIARFPEGPALYPDGQLTDEPDEQLVAELVREAALEGLTDELPHSLAVLVEEMVLREGRDDFLEVRVTLYVERPSQKGILIGKNGSRMKDVGVKARRQIEPLLGMRIHLDLRVTVAKDWQRDPKQLRKLGF